MQSVHAKITSISSHVYSRSRHLKRCCSTTVCFPCVCFSKIEALNTVTGLKYCVPFYIFWPVCFFFLFACVCFELRLISFFHMGFLNFHRLYLGSCSSHRRVSWIFSPPFRLKFLFLSFLFLNVSFVSGHALLLHDWLLFFTNVDLNISFLPIFGLRETRWGKWKRSVS